MKRLNGDIMKRLIAVAACLVISAAGAMAWGEAKAEFPLRDGDVWVMAGDSITEQHLHSNYFEAFCFARYPHLRFGFRNGGAGGATVPSTLARFDQDIANWRPTVVSIALGMNDQMRTPVDTFIATMATMVERVRGIKARPVIFTPNPINNGETMAQLSNNARLHEYAVALRQYAEREKIPFADQFHQLVDVWGNNKPREVLANTIPVMKQIAADDKVAGVAHLRAFLAAQEKEPVKPVSMQGDPVHPGAPGQLLMAAALLKDLGAEGFVSSAVIDAQGNVVEAKGCRIDAVKTEGGRLQFDRLDERLPMPIPDEALPAIPLFPAVLDLSRYMLTVTGLQDGSYTLKINGVPAGTLSAKQLAAGVNLTALGPVAGSREPSPILAQSRAILKAIENKRGAAKAWRVASFPVKPDATPALKAQLAEATGKVEAEDEKIRAAARPQKLHFEIGPAETAAPGR